MREQNILCSDCRHLVDSIRTLAHEYLLETDSSGRSYQCLICDAHLICQRSAGATYWTEMPSPDPEATIPMRPSAQAHRPLHRPR